MYEDVSRAYYGGLNLVFTPYGKGKIYQYDINSFYPAAATLMTAPGRETRTITYHIPRVIFDESELPLGVYKVNIEYPKNYNKILGLLPVRTDKGLYFPVDLERKMEG